MSSKLSELDSNPCKLPEIEQKTINELVQEAHKNAIDHGWWLDNRSFGEIIALMHSELSEALEEYRNGKQMNEVYVIEGKPEGIPIELADCIIRIFDFCGRNKIDLQKAIAVKMKYNESRPYRHGGKII